MSMKYLPLIAALAIATPAGAITVNMSGFTNNPPKSARITGTGGAPSYEGTAGQFSGQRSDDSPPMDSARFSTNALVDPTSFVAWCAEITQDFNFNVEYDYADSTGASYFGAQKATDLSRLFTAAQGFVVDSTTAAAMQAAIWEVIYETNLQGGYSLFGGNFLGSASDRADQSAFDAVNSFLTSLSSYSASYQIEVLTNGDRQDFLVATIPEPETWALFAAGLGVLGALKRRRRTA